MKWRNWLDKWSMNSLRISAPFLNMEWSPATSDKDAAWELYIELLTRITIQPLAMEDGDEQTALSSVHSLFGLTRSIIKTHGRECSEFTKIAIVVLNQIIRPFTSRWHQALLNGEFADKERCQHFRAELEDLQKQLRNYTRMLAEMAGVEDLTMIEN